MARRNRIIRMDKWDEGLGKPKLMSDRIPLCDLSPRPAMHRIWDTIYFSQFKRSKEGRSFREIKTSTDDAAIFARAACDFLNTLVNSFEGWAIVTTPRRRHDDGFHFATEVCRIMSATLGIPFYDGAVATMNRDRLHPDFILLREIAEPRVIVYDDIITTGATLIATSALFQEKEIVLNIIGISNR